LGYFYRLHKQRYRERYPDKPRLFADKHGLRVAQKILDACAWKVWREAYNLPAPEPYAFDILKHEGRIIRMSDLYDFNKAEPDLGGVGRHGRVGE